MVLPLRWKRNTRVDDPVDVPDGQAPVGISVSSPGVGCVLPAPARIRGGGCSPVPCVRNGMLRWLVATRMRVL